MKQLKLGFVEDGSVWVSDGVQMLTSTIAVEYSLDSYGEVTIQQSSTGDTWFEIPDFSKSGQNGMFNISGGVNGLYIRFITNVEPNYISVTL